jgi:hypothetical protein
MKILLTGPIEGHIDAFYAHAREQKPNWVISAGDFGVWPDPHRMDKASRHHAEDDFAKHYVGVMKEPIMIPTLLIAGVHDDHKWLEYRRSVNNTEILANVHWLAQGFRTEIGWDNEPFRVTGLGRAYSEATYKGEVGKRSHRHYTRQDVERACSSGPTDLLVIYEHLDAPGIRNIIFATRPKLIINAKHPNRGIYHEIQNTPVIQLGRMESKLVTWEDRKFIF